MVKQYQWPNDSSGSISLCPSVTHGQWAVSVDNTVSESIKGNRGVKPGDGERVFPAMCASVKRARPPAVMSVTWGEVSSKDW